jgi:hypothetical protein
MDSKMRSGFSCRMAEAAPLWVWLWMSRRKMILPPRHRASPLPLKRTCSKKSNRSALISWKRIRDRALKLFRVCPQAMGAAALAVVDRHQGEYNGTKSHDLWNPCLTLLRPGSGSLRRQGRVYQHRGRPEKAGGNADLLRREISGPRNR